MASVRELKKDINFVCAELVIECLTFDYLFPTKDKDKISAIVAETLVLQNDLLDKVNKVKSAKDLPAKSQYGQIRKEMFKEIISLADRLNKINN